MDKNPNTEERPICRNCGSTKTDAEINAAGWIACCPERDTRPEQAHAAKDSPTLQGVIADLRGLAEPDKGLSYKGGRFSAKEELYVYGANAGRACRVIERAGEIADALSRPTTLQDEGVRAAVQRVTAYLDEETKYAGGVSPRHWPKGPHLSYGDLRVILAALSPHVTRYRGAQS